MLVSWEEARAYCDWLTERLREIAPERLAAAGDAAAERFWRGFAAGESRAALPSDAQWEAAARGPEARLYPWGDEAPDAEHAHFGKTAGTTPVGTYAHWPLFPSSTVALASSSVNLLLSWILS